LSGHSAAPGDRRFAREYRLLRPQDFERVFAARHSLRSGALVLHYLPNGLTGARLGLVIPKKLASRAVLRNAIKRRMREAFRQCRGELPALDLVVRLLRPVGAPPSVVELAGALRQLLVRIAAGTANP